MNQQELTRQICIVSDLLKAKTDQIAVLNLATALNLINASMVQVSLSSREIKLEGVTFGERGIGRLIANSLSGI